MLRNDVTGENHWLKVKLIGVKSNRSAIGARVTVEYSRKRQAQEVLAQSSYFSVSDRRLQFGLGSTVNANIEIRWPNGDKQTFSDVTANQLVIVEEGTDSIISEKFPA